MEFIKELALETGSLTLAGHGRCDQVPKDSKDGYDISTEYDIQAEELVRTRIMQVFGEPVLGEEDGLIGGPEEARRDLWIVDPIDGTFNYQRGLPFYGVSIAYCVDGVPSCGAIYLPALTQLFYASRYTGAFLIDGRGAEPVQIHVNPTWQDRSLIIGLSGKDAYQLTTAFSDEKIPWRTMRYTMCAVADLAYLAAGRMDAYYHTALNLWDCAAADIILRAAGGPPCSDFDGNAIFPTYVEHCLESGGAVPFSFVAASSLDLFDQPLKRILSRLERNRGRVHGPSDSAQGASDVVEHESSAELDKEESLHAET
jgi:myo-inositol-1(or 4)-monophosphatase